MRGLVTRSWLIALSSLAALAAVALLGALYSTFSQPWPARATKLRAVTPPSSAATAPPEAASAASNLETARLDARRQAYAAIDALIQASELEQARKLLDEDDQRYGDDLAPEWHDLGQSYRLLADCLEHPSPKLRVRAEAFVLVSQAANLKSRILAACAKTPRR